MAHNSLTVMPVAGALGAEIGGVDLSDDLPDNTVPAIRQALLDHLVVVFRDPTRTPEQLLAFARRFGEPGAYQSVKCHDPHPGNTPLPKRGEEGDNYGRQNRQTNET